LSPQIRAALGVLTALMCWLLFVPSDATSLPTLVKVALAFWRLAESGRLFDDAAASIVRVFFGVGISICLSLILAFVAVMHPPIVDYLSGLTELVRPVPPIAWTPIAVVSFGIGDYPAIAIVASGSFFPIWLGITRGLQEVRPAHLAAARSLGANKFRLIWEIFMPSVLPYAFHGFRLGTGLGWFCVVAAEMVGASSGLGFGIQLFSLNLEMEKLYAYIVCIGVIGFITNMILLDIDQRLNLWRERPDG
jgi:ABC-type nitrate/sulfonate/bicarbonate transport system permease component